jgi:hypothetical protein
MLFDAAVWYLDRVACSRMWLIVRYANNEYLHYIYANCGFLSMTSAKSRKGGKSFSSKNVALTDVFRSKSIDRFLIMLMLNLR